jgi:hypothetical protein
MRENEAKTSYWTQQVQALGTSGLSRRAYCEQNNIKLSQLGYWCRKLTSPAKADSAASWIPLQINEEESASIDLQIGRITIAVKPGFDPSLLADVLRTLNAIC